MTLLVSSAYIHLSERNAKIPVNSSYSVNWEEEEKIGWQRLFLQWDKSNTI